VSPAARNTPAKLADVTGMLYLHAVVNRGFGNVAWSEIWQSAGSGIPGDVGQ
jgi:hypothetical protein